MSRQPTRVARRATRPHRKAVRQPRVLSPEALALRNAQAVDLHFTSEHVEVRKLADDLLRTLSRNSTVIRSEQLAKHVVVVLLNLYSAWLNDPARYVRYSRGSDNYRHTRYHPQQIWLKRLKKVIGALERAQLVKNKLGIPGRFNFADGKQSRVRATAKLSERFQSFSEGMIQRVDNEVIILKGPKDLRGRANFIEYSDTQETRAMRQRLLEINSRIADARIDLYVSDDQMRDLALRLQRDPRREPVDFRRTALRRIFNDGRWDHGGRLYHGWWQEIPSAYRGWIVINDRQTIEIDFSGIHFAILYADAGLPAPDGDPYALPDCEPGKRGVVKRALNILINADSEHQARGKISQIMAEEGPPAAYPTAANLLAALKAKHAPIASFFASGAGIRAQFKDSQVAEEILLRLGVNGAVALPVHDSFIVEERHEEALRDAMAGAFQRIVARPSRLKMKAQPWYRREAPRPELSIRAADAEHRQTYSGFFARELAWQRKARNEARRTP